MSSLATVLPVKEDMKGEKTCKISINDLPQSLEILTLEDVSMGEEEATSIEDLTTEIEDLVENDTSLAKGDSDGDLIDFFSRELALKRL